MRNVGFDGFFHRVGRRKNGVRRAIDVSLDGMQSLLSRGVNRRDSNHQVIPELGYRMGLWSGRPDDEAFGLDIHCGSYSKWVGNNVTLTLPSAGPHCLELARVEAEALFDELVGIWQPEKAVLCHADELRWECGRIPTDISSFKRYSSDAEPFVAPDRRPPR
jgi:hypothetical protein